MVLLSVMAAMVGTAAPAQQVAPEAVEVWRYWFSLRCLCETTA
jgi:hypothetical protein